MWGCIAVLSGQETTFVWAISAGVNSALSVYCVLCLLTRNLDLSLPGSEGHTRPSGWQPSTMWALWCLPLTAVCHSVTVVDTLVPVPHCNVSQFDSGVYMVPGLFLLLFSWNRRDFETIAQQKKRGCWY